MGKIRKTYSKEIKLRAIQRSQIWSTRLYEQSEVIIKYFRDKEPIIRILQKWIDEPPTNRETVLELFKKEGKWTSENFEREARIPS